MKLFLCCVSVAILLATSCGKNASVESVLDHVKSVAREHPDSALQLIRSIDRNDIRRDATLARYALNYSIMLDWNGIKVTQDTLIRIAVDYYQKHGSACQKSKALFYQALVYQNSGDLAKMTDCFVSAEVISRDDKDEEPILYASICYELGRCFYILKDMDQAIAYFKKAEESYRQANCFLNEGAIYYCYAIIDLDKRDFPAAIKNMEQCIDLCKKGEATDSLIGIFERTKMIAEIKNENITSQEMCRRLDKMYGSIPPAQIDEKEYHNYAFAYDLVQNIDSVRYYEHKVLALSDDAENKIQVYLNLYRAEKKYGDRRKAFEYHEQYIQLRDSVNDYLRNTAIQAISQRTAAEKLQMEYKSLKATNRYHVVIALLLILSAVLSILQLRRVHRERRLKLLQAQRCEMHRRQDQINELTMAHAHLKREYDLLIEQAGDALPLDEQLRACRMIETRMDKIAQLTDKYFQNKPDPHPLFDVFVDFVRISPNKPENGFADLQFVVNLKQGGVLAYLRNKYPEILETDLDLCAMLCYGFTGLSMSFIYGYEDPGSLYNRRSRIRRRIQAPSGKKLEDYLFELGQKLRDERALKSKNETDTEQIFAAG